MIARPVWARARAVWFAYSPDREGEHPREHLKDFAGTLQADAYSGFHHLCDTGRRIREAACWAHARRRFHDIHAAHPSPTTTDALERIGALYRIEDEIRGRLAEERRKIRQTRAAPLLEELRCSAVSAWKVCTSMLSAKLIRAHQLHAAESDFF